MRDVFHLWSNAGEIGFLGPILKAEGHRVTWQTHMPGAETMLRRIVPRGSAEPGAIVLFDTTGHGGFGESYRARKHPVIGGHPLDRTLEMDRARAIRIAEQIGLAVPEWHGFTNVAAAIRFLEGDAEGGAWFVKCSGPHVDEASTTSAPTVEGMIRHLRTVRDVQSFVLQRKVDGLEIDVDGFFNGREFVAPFFWTIEDKKFMDGDLGPNVGCMTSLVGTWRSDCPRLVAETVARIEPILAEGCYRGDVACNLKIADDGTPYFLEWTLRFGFSAFQAQCLLLEPDTIGEQLAALARGRLREWSLQSQPLALAVSVSIPPFPTFDTKLIAKTVGRPLDDRLDGTHPRLLVNAVRRGDDGRIEAAGGYAVIVEVGAVGSDVNVLRREALALADDLNVPQKQYRRELAKRYERAIGVLTNFGYDDGAFSAPASTPETPKENAA